MDIKDCTPIIIFLGVRLLGIGRNEYIDLMNQCRSGRKLFRRRNVKDHLPSKPARIPIEPWWVVLLGLVTEDDVKRASQAEKLMIDRIIDHGPQKAGLCDRELLHSLYKWVLQHNNHLFLIFHTFTLLRCYFTIVLFLFPTPLISVILFQQGAGLP